MYCPTNTSSNAAMPLRTSTDRRSTDAFEQNKIFTNRDHAGTRILFAQAASPYDDSSPRTAAKSFWHILAGRIYEDPSDSSRSPGRPHPRRLLHSQAMIMSFPCLTYTFVSFLTHARTQEEIAPLLWPNDGVSTEKVAAIPPILTSVLLQTTHDPAEITIDLRAYHGDVAEFQFRRPNFVT